MSPKDLAQVLCHLDKTQYKDDPNVLVSFDLMDDAGVYRISDYMALVQTVDFFTPIVDDPFMYGQIAAANAFSDIYAMGGKPLTALSIACFSPSVDPGLLSEILKGGEAKIKEAGAVLLGGHTVTDEEIKYGLAVTGMIHPEKVITNAGAKPGDALIITKPLGTGILTTGHKFDFIKESELEEAILSMTTLNRSASEAMQKAGVKGCTDVTGFGLIGHSMEMAKASQVKIRIHYDRIPVMKQVLDLAAKEAIPGGAYSNMSHFQSEVCIIKNITDPEKIIIFDPQTSGGLLMSVPKDQADSLVALINENQPAWAGVIGEVIEKGGDDEHFIEVV